MSTRSRLEMGKLLCTARGRRGHDHMVVRSITIYAISAYHN